MYGDCQVLSAVTTMGGNPISIPTDNSSSIFSSSSSIQNNTNFNFMANINPFNMFAPITPKEETALAGLSKNKDEMLESGSGSDHIEGGSGNEQDAADQQQQQTKTNKKKRYHRHTARQIQEMEAMFKECPHPDDKQRLRLSQDLGLKPRQVKFWFQNRRTQMKAQHDRQDNVVLRAENEGLKNENYRLQATLRNIICPNCGGAAMLGEFGFDDQQLRIENERLKEEYDRMCCLVSQYTSRSMVSLDPTPLLAPSLDLDMSPYPRKFDQDSISNCTADRMIPLSFLHENSGFPANRMMILEEEKPLALELAMSSMDELLKMCHIGEPLWTPSIEMGKLVLNIEEYGRMFSWPGNLVKQHPPECRIEATRHASVVIMNSITLVDAFLDANKWMELFPSIVSRAKMVQVVHQEIPGRASGSLHLMYAELQFLSPLVPAREAHFLRYCQHNSEEGTWAIVDFPMDGFQNDNPPAFLYYKRRPSGCIIQDMPNGYSRVTWIEHAEVEYGPIHQVFYGLVSSGVAFGAQRWLAVLQRQCERLASLMARNISDLGVIPSPEARKSVMNLSQRMIRTFCLNISTCSGQSWTALSDSADDTVRITTRKVTEPGHGQPNGLILTAVSTTWLPYQHNQVFDFLRDERRRAQLEVLSNGNSLHEVAHIANGSNPGNCISLLRINVASNSSQSLELVLQESCSDDSGSMVVYATVDVEAIQMAMNGGDPSCIPLLPLGFAIHPMESSSMDMDKGGNNKPSEPSCLLTVGIQVLASTIPTSKLNLSSVTAVNHHLCNIIQQINTLLGSDLPETGHVAAACNKIKVEMPQPPPPEMPMDPCSSTTL